MCLICSHILQEQVYMSVIRSDILHQIFMQDINDNRDLMFYIRWGMMHTDCQLNNMPYKQGLILIKRQTKTLRGIVNS